MNLQPKKLNFLNYSTTHPTYVNMCITLYNIRKSKDFRYVERYLCANAEKAHQRHNYLPVSEMNNNNENEKHKAFVSIQI